MTALFEWVWPQAIGAVLLAVAVLGALRRGGRAWLVPALALAACLAWLATSLAVQTPREAVRAQTAALVEMAAPLDRAAFERLMSDRAAVLGPGGGVLLDRDTLLAQLTRYGARGAEGDHRLVSSDIEMRGDAAASALIRVRSRGGAAQFPTLTDWDVLWQRDADGPWRVHTLRWLAMNGSAPPTGVLR